MEFQWTSHTWKAPDGKLVPYKSADITELFPQIDIDWNWDGSGDVWIEASQFPRNTKVMLCRITTIGGGGSTGSPTSTSLTTGGDFEGTDEFIERFQLAQYPNVTFWADVMRDKDDIQRRAMRIVK